MTIQKKLLFAFFSIALLVLAVGSYTINSSLTAQIESETLYSGTAKEIAALQSLAYHLEIVSSNMREILLENSKEYHQKLVGLELNEIENARMQINQGINGADTALKDWEKALAVWVSHAEEDGQHDAYKEKRVADFKKLQLRLLPYLDELKLFLTDFDTKGRIAAYERFEYSLERSFRELHNDIALFIKEEQQEADTTFTALFKSNQQTINYNIVAIIAAFIIAITLGLLISRTFSHPLNKLTNASRQIAEGNLDQHLNLRTGGELQILADTFNSMANSLKEYHDHMEQMIEDRTSDLNDAKKAAEQASETKSQFLSRVSHELRTPMNAIMGFGQLLKDEETNEEKTEYLNGILFAGNHLVKLIDEVLDISRIDAQEIKLSIEDTDLSKILSECIYLIQPMAIKHKVSILGDHTQMPRIKADSFRLKQILLNLLSNAIKYNNEQGTVTIKQTAIDGDMLRLEIIDTGHGIKQDMQALVFEPFTRVAANSDTIEGAGIGLTITKKLVEVMGGSIGLSSEEDAGSTFWIELPLAPNAESADYDAANTTNIRHLQAGSALPNYKVLYIEDDAISVKLMETILSSHTNYKLLSSPTAELGIALAIAHQPKLIILDMNLPDMNGFHLLQKIRNNYKTSNTPIIAFDAHATPADITNGIKQGFFAYLTKPIDMPLLNEKIKMATEEPGANFCYKI